jgi:hypothetical protein
VGRKAIEGENRINEGNYDDHDRMCGDGGENHSE